MLLVRRIEMLQHLFALLLIIGEAADASQLSAQNRLVSKVLASYDKRVKPTRLSDEAVVVTFSMELYQIIEVNEHRQYILVNTWIIERWKDEFLYWDPADYDGIEEVMLPHEELWLPDTTLYNTLVMEADESRRLMNAKVQTNTTDQSVYVELLYPTIYKFSCQLNIYYFPFDSQICNMTFGSWTYDKSGIDYFPYSENVGTSSFLENEVWTINSFRATRRELKYACCPNNYTNLYYTLHMKRKPLFYMVNLIIPTCIITLISIIGFFTPSSASGERNEKVTLGITTLLSMSILMLMVSDKMPTTSTFVPLMSWFLLGMIMLISLSTVSSSAVIMVQKMGYQGERASTRIIRIACPISRLIRITIPNHLNDLDQHRHRKEKTTCVIIMILSIVMAALKYGFIYRYINLIEYERYSLMTRENKKSGSSEIELLRKTSSRYLPPSFETATYLLHQYNSNGDAPKPLESDDTPRKLSAFKAAVLKQRKVTSDGEKTNRALIHREFEWLASVVERCAFAFYFSLFLLLSFGINGVGMMHWLSS